MDPNPSGGGGSLSDLTIDTVDCYWERTSTGERTAIENVTKLTGTTFYLDESAAVTFFFAIKKTGENANKEVKAIAVERATGVIEFDNNTADYNLYKAPNNQATNVAGDMVLRLNFDGGEYLYVYCPEVDEPRAPTSLDDFPTVFNLNVE